MRDESYKIELFVFPDGTSVEMLVFDARPPRRRRGAGLARLPAPGRCAHVGARPVPRATAAAPRTPTRTTVPSAAARWSTRWTGSVLATAAWTLQPPLPRVRDAARGDAGSRLRRAVQPRAVPRRPGHRPRGRRSMTRRNFEDEVGAGSSSRSSATSSCRWTSRRGLRARPAPPAVRQPHARHHHDRRCRLRER